MATPPPGASGSLRPARWATRVQFCAFGFLTGVWGAHIPTVKAHYAIDEGQLAMALLAAAIGAVACLTQAGAVIAAAGARRIALAAGVTMCTVLALVLVTDRLALLIALMLAFGGASGLLDVAINAEGSVLEERSGKKVMSGFHGMFSAGGMLGAGAAGLLIGAGVAPLRQLLGLAAAMAATVATASVFMLSVHPPDPQPGARYRLPRGVLAVLGVLAAIGLVAEGAMYDWSVLYVQQETGATPAFAALGYASFSAAMAATRFGGDWLRTHVNPPRLMAASGLVGAASMLLVLLVRDPVIAVIGFALVGVGFANVVPILFIAATRVPGVSQASAIAAVSSIGYLGFMVGPPLVGGIAHAASLSWGLGVVVAGALLLAWGARRIPR
jgi:fucose permease